VTIGEFFVWIVAVLIYSGPVLPLSATLLLRRASRERFRSNLRLLAILMAVQVVLFLPFIFGVMFEWPDSLHTLIFPFCSGVLLFLVALVYSTRECIQLRSLQRSSDEAHVRAAHPP
jgi:hypothetical protein